MQGSSSAGGSSEAHPSARTTGVPPDPDLPEWLSLHDYGLIGNQRTAALVSRHGSIDWACFPRFDSPSAFGRLLDRRRGGYASVGPAGPYVSHQQYVASTNILATFFDLGWGVVLTVTDFMPTGPIPRAPAGEPRIVRRLVARGAPIEVCVRADPRFSYGLQVPRWAIRSELAVASAESGRLAFTSPWPWREEGSSAIAAGSVVPGAPLFLQIRWGDAPSDDPSPSQLLAVTDAYWRAWVSPPEAPMRRVAARWQPWVERSELVLKLLGYAHSGVFVAAPTTSLPEWPGGTRNWDYRFVWIRDAAFTSQVLLLLGHVTEARAYAEWAFARADQLRPGEDLHSIYSIEGDHRHEEVEASHLEGYLGSRPVRIGNSAAAQLQLDVYGEILDVAYILERIDPVFVRDHWSTIERLAQQTSELWSSPDHGIWEFRMPPAHYVHSKLMCWVGLDRAIHLAEAFGKTEPVDRWKRTRDEIRASLLSRGYDDRRGSFIQAYDRPRIDASALRIPLVGFLPPTDPRVVHTIAAVERTLGHEGLLRRYEGEDGLPGPEGDFLLCSFWLVEALAKSGQMDRALEHWRTLLDLAGPLRLFSEEYDPATNRPLGNYPQAFTHIGVLRAAFALGLVGSDGS